MGMSARPYSIEHIDTACLLININGYKILTDPVFDAPGGFYSFGLGTFSKKYSKPKIDAKDLGHIDLVLLSHEHHGDNLDVLGRTVAQGAKRIITTPRASKKFAQATALTEFNSISIDDPRVPGLKITATPAQHAQFAFMNPLAGHVIGFVLEFNSQTNGVLYISGDTVFFKGINEVAKQFPTIETAVLHMGCAGFPYLSGPLRYTMNSSDAVKAIEVLNPKRAIPIHTGGWWHFREPEALMRQQMMASAQAKRIEFLE
jgi:L-ascorbate metabolism protein UlaG (beta-lactamase superfamily)